MRHADPFKGLNSEQLRAVNTVNGRVLILAGAGSGKTSVLTMRMAHLIKNLHISPKAILGLTFTNKAAAEMRHRMASIVEPAAARQVTLCTFHSFCMRVLREDISLLGYTSEFSLYDEKDVKRLAAMIARDILEQEGELPSLEATMAAISMAKSRGIKPEGISQTGSEWHDGFARDVYKRLQDSMRAYNAVDFDHLLWLAVELFENHPKVREKYQERFRYIMIDEYQDTNPIQYRLAALLSEKYGNLCVVGDDDQSIYGWRGADIRNILEFDQATVIRLEQNYRSTNTILKAANALIHHNTKRHVKALWSEKGVGEPIEVFYADDEIKEAEAVVCRIVKMRETKGLRWSDFAILYRSNALSRALELAMMKYSWRDRDAWVRGIPYEICSGQEFFERREVRDLFAYLRLIVNSRDQEALLRIINQPRRGIGEGTLDALTAYNRNNSLSLWDVLVKICRGETVLKESINAKALHGIEDFVCSIETARDKFFSQPLFEAMIWLIERINYKKAIYEEVKSEQMRDFKWENVQGFVSALSDFEEHCKNGLERRPTLQDFITELPLEKDWEKRDAQKGIRQDTVKLMTFHSAKGLEFPACFLIGVEDHIIPHEKSLLDTGLEEERRLMYVALTRAMKHLTISMAARRKKMGKDSISKPSRFLFEIPIELMNKTKWSDV